MAADAPAVSVGSISSYKTLIKCTPKYQIYWGNNWRIAQIMRQALYLWHKFDAFLAIWAIFFSIISSISFLLRVVLYQGFTVFILPWCCGTVVGWRMSLEGRPVCLGSWYLRGICVWTLVWFEDPVPVTWWAMWELFIQRSLSLTTFSFANEECGRFSLPRGI